eukprot:764081-Amphidinium_carterae.1
MVLWVLAICKVLSSVLPPRSIGDDISWFAIPVGIDGSVFACEGIYKLGLCRFECHFLECCGAPLQCLMLVMPPTP